MYGSALSVPSSRPPRLKKLKKVTLKRFESVKGDYTLICLNSGTGICDEKAIDIAPECIRFFVRTTEKIKIAETHQDKAA